ncbi:MAG: hypothetical protein LBE24_01545 [Methylobacillus sp.]|nr:hypothetical protein [Methylobacillus sp.]
MKVRTSIFLLTIIAAAISGCDLLESGTHWKSDKFEVGWTDIRSNSNLFYRMDNNADSVSIVTACVFAAGANEQYIVVKQHPASDPATLNYYVLAKALYDPTERDHSESLAGPLTEEAYREMATRLALPELESVISESECRGSA